MITKLPLPLGGGVDLFSDPASIPDGNWQLLKNLSPRQNGVLGRRHSLSFVREVEPSWWHWDARTGEGFPDVAAAVPHYYRWAKYLRPLKFIFDPNFGNLTMVLLTTDTVRVLQVTSAVDGFPTPQRIATERDVPAGTLLLVCLPGMMNEGSSATEPVLRCAVLGEASRCPSLFVFNGRTYCVGGSDNGASVIPAGTTTSSRFGLFDDTFPGDPGLPVNFDYISNYFGSGNQEFAPYGAAVVRDRVVYFKGPNLYFSDRQDPLIIGFTGSTDANGVIVPSSQNPPVGTNYSAIETRGILVGGEELEDITAVAELSTTADGSPQQSIVMAWTNNHCYMLLGEPLETTEGGSVIGTLQVNKLNIAAGCVSQNTVTRTPYGTFWVGMDDVWFMPFGSLPIRVGTKIRPYIQNQPGGLLWRLHAEYANGMYMVAMFAEGQGPSVFDPCGAHFWLNLKNGPPMDANSAQWFGPQLLVQTDAPSAQGDLGGSGGTYCLSRDQRANGDNRTYSLQPWMIQGNVQNEYAYGLSLCSFDQTEDKDTTAPQRPRTVAWQPGYEYYEGDEIVPPPSATSYNSLIYTCVVSGISGLTEPDWYTPAGDGEIVDNTITWECKYFDQATGSVVSAYFPNILQGGTNIGDLPGNFIEWELLSKEYFFDGAEHEILLDGAEIVATLGQATRLTYNTHPQQDLRSRVWAPNFNTIATTGTTQLERFWQAKLLTPDPTKRFNALSGVLSVTQDSGIVIVAGVSDSWDMVVGGTPYTITVPAGYYASLTDLNTALKASYLAATGGILTSSIGANGNNLAAVVSLEDAARTLSLVTTGQLAHYFGFIAEQSPTSAGAGDPCSGRESPATRLVPDMLFAALKLRHSSFDRDPT